MHYSLAAHQQKNTALRITTFSHEGKNTELNWLQSGLPLLFTDYLSNTEVISVRHKDTKSTTKNMYVLDGTFHELKGNLQIYLSLKDGNSKLLKTFSLKTPYPEHTAFFETIENASKDILKTLKLSFHEEKMKQIRNRTQSTEAYKWFAKGHEALFEFTEASAKKALNFFEEAKSADPRSPLGYQGIIDANTFLGLVAKQKRKNFSPFYQAALKEIEVMRKITKGKETPSLLAFEADNTGNHKKAQKPINRFLASHNAFLEALHYGDQQQLKKAFTALKTTVDLVPEDAVAWHFLADVANKLGKHKEAKAAYDQVQRLDPCFGKKGNSL